VLINFDLRTEEIGLEVRTIDERDLGQGQRRGTRRGISQPSGVPYRAMD